MSQAVAENQPRKKNRMTSELSKLAARFRDLCRASTSNGLASSLSDAPFNQLALELFELQFNANAVFRSFCKSRGFMPGVIEDWTCIPAVPTTAFKDADLTCLRPEERIAAFHSSGTTGQSRSRHFHSHESLAVYEDPSWISMASPSSRSSWRLKAGKD